MSGKAKAKIISNDPSQDIAPVSVYGAVEYSMDAEALAKLAKQSAGIKEVNSTKDLQTLMPYIAALRDKRVALDKERKVLKAGAVAHGKLVESEANTLIDIIQPEEKRLQAIRKVFEDAAALVKQKKIEAEVKRTGVHKSNIQFITETPGRLIEGKAGADEMTVVINNLIEMNLESFEEFSEQAQGAIETATSVLGMAVRLAEDQAKQAELEAMRQAEQDKDNRIRAAEKKAMEEKQDRIDAQQKENEAEAERLKQEKINQEAKIERDKQAAKQKIIDDKAAVKQAAIEKKAQAKAEKKRLADIEKCRPDSEKLVEFVDVLRGLYIPELDTNQGVITWIEQDIDTLAKKITYAANGMIS